MPINEAQAQTTATTYRGDGRYPSGLHDGAETGTAASGQTKTEVPLAMETEITRENLMLAYQRVVENKGAAGVDNLSVDRLKDKIRRLTTGNRSKSVKATLDELTPVLRGWISYFRLTEVRGTLEELDGWIKRRRRCLLWRQ